MTAKPVRDNRDMSDCDLLDMYDFLTKDDDLMVTFMAMNLKNASLISSDHCLFVIPAPCGLISSEIPRIMNFLIIQKNP